MKTIHRFIPPHLIWEAKKRVYQIIERTPTIKSEYLSNVIDGNVYLKLENTQAISAFKVRGAANKILALSPEELQKGVTTFSTGNHGLAVSYIAKKLGVKAVICMSSRVPQAKLERIAELGAEIEIFGSSQDDAKKRCDQLHEKEGLTIIPPFDDKDIISGQATIGLEILEDVPLIDCAIVPLSGGGLLAGVGYVLKNYNETISISGVSMEQGATMYESLKAGHPIEVMEVDTLADSLLGGIGLNNQYTFPLVQQLVDEVHLVSETDIAYSMGLLADKHRLIVEGAAATGVAALLHHKDRYKGKNVVLVISGSNVDLKVIHQVIGQYLNQNQVIK
ncbi:hydroxyectoine utilization dehydratase EutB [Halalkalibacter okhensis]|uniref:threonine ammonia-lyase n=1 Tax=Halalkalibacter okhensis TaxID=333138 RepID=A0A0B0IEK4_9BACI|nr:hydroxyectoine utilization dehydratase EutB [Halalkalibacter okhensis]KHF38484.1 threonine dehydratase [Halalkalibacter okhensis]